MGGHRRHHSRSVVDCKAPPFEHAPYADKGCRMKVDMSPEAVGRRLRKVGELVRLCRALRIKPGSVRPVEAANDNAPPLGKTEPSVNQAGDPTVRQSPGQQQQSNQDCPSHRSRLVGDKFAARLPHGAVRGCMTRHSAARPTATTTAPTTAAATSGFVSSSGHHCKPRIPTHRRKIHSGKPGWIGLSPSTAS